ncbi:hypothetical protein niasHT_015253 [Heterodera trifolii]|uniref:Uncharacterized protein n=1 Tax=Heterodera trifolii TaxID=157864 RepID=A0ABD2L2N0_9BILA
MKICSQISQLLLILFVLSVPSYDAKSNSAASVNQQLISYGQLILVGKTGVKMNFDQRAEPNGIQQNPSAMIGRTAWANNQWPNYPMPWPISANDEEDTTTHSITFSFSDIQQVVAQYSQDQNRDMFQIGRENSEKIDFVIDHATTISRFACRIVAERNAPNNVYIYAAGFDDSNDLFLGPDANKIEKPNGQFDGLVTNGVLILSPNDNDDEGASVYLSASSSNNGDDENESDSEISPNCWKEVSVNGNIYSKREVRSPGVMGELLPGKTNKIVDGTLIDLCGATLLWRSAEGLKNSPTEQVLRERLDKLNLEQRPQCPVHMHTLVFDRTDSGQIADQTDGSSSNTRQFRTPYVYKNCGHVQSNHNWESLFDGQHTCPICKNSSDAIIKLTFGFEPAFHIDTAQFDHAFIPCGHIASETTVKHWSKTLIPNGGQSFHKICPFCNTPLDNGKPFTKLYFC